MLNNKEKRKIPRLAVTGKVGVVVARFNEFITQRLLTGCLDALAEAGVKGKDIHVVEVPGAFEIPLAALKLAQKKNVVGVICLGAVIRGETFHFEIVAENAGRGILEVGLKTGKPVIMGVITTDTVEQAQARSDDKGSNKGREAVETLAEMLASLKTIKN